MEIISIAVDRLGSYVRVGVSLAGGGVEVTHLSISDYMAWVSDQTGLSVSGPTVDKADVMLWDIATAEGLL